MRRIALIQNGVVQNIATWDGLTPWNPGSEFVCVDVTGTSVDIGWTTTDNVNFTPPSED